MSTQRYRLTFDRGGECEIEVSEDEAALFRFIKPEMAERDGGGWLGAAILKSHMLKLNPGGPLTFKRIDDDPASA